MPAWTNQVSALIVIEEEEEEDGRFMNMRETHTIEENVVRSAER